MEKFIKSAPAGAVWSGKQHVLQAAQALVVRELETQGRHGDVAAVEQILVRTGIDGVRRDLAFQPPVGLAARVLAFFHTALVCGQMRRPLASESGPRG